MSIDLQSEIRSFQTQLFPSAEDISITNGHALYKQKKLFLNDLRQGFKVLGFLLIGLLYLRDNSLVLLIIKFNMHYRVSLCRGTDNPTLPTEATFLGQRTVGTHMFAMLYHLVFGVFTPHTNDHFLHGSLTVQFIGETAPSGRLELFLLDLVTFAAVWIYYCLMCHTEDTEVLLPVPDTDIARCRSEGNGYTGRVHLMDIRPIEILVAQQDAYITRVSEQAETV